jgi:O-antigen/teichoic acid export membrane protein
MALSLLVARLLGVEGLGKYAVLTAYLPVFQTAAMMGVPRLAIREMARRPDRQRNWFQRTVTNQLIGATVFAALLILAANLLSHPTDTRRALEVVALSLFPFAISSATESTLQAREQMSFIALAQIGARGIQVIGSILALLSGYGVMALAWMIVAGQSLVAVIESSVALSIGLWKGFRADLHGAMRLFQQSFDFFVQSVFVIAFSRLDILVLSQMAGERATGVYNAANLIIQVINFLSGSYSNAVYPVLSRFFNKTPKRFETLLSKSLLFGLVATLLIAILLMNAAEPVIGCLFPDKDYTISVLLLRIEAPFIIIYMWNTLLASGLIASNLQRRSVIVSGVKLGVGLICYPLLTTWLGVIGTGVATVLTAFTGAILNFHFFNRDVLSLDLLLLAVKPFSVGTIVVFSLWIVRDWAWPKSTALGIVFYISLLIVFRIILRQDIFLFQRLIRPSRNNIEV